MGSHITEEAHLVYSITTTTTKKQLKTTRDFIDRSRKDYNGNQSIRTVGMAPKCLEPNEQGQSLTPYISMLNTQSRAAE